MMSYKNLTYVEFLSYWESAAYECEILRKWTYTVRLRVVSIRHTRHGSSFKEIATKSTPTKKIGDVFNAKLETLTPYFPTAEHLDATYHDLTHESYKAGRKSVLDQLKKL